MPKTNEFHKGETKRAKKFSPFRVVSLKKIEILVPLVSNHLRTTNHGRSIIQNI